MDEVYISVDIESAGPIPGRYSMLSLGACTVELPRRLWSRKHRDQATTFYREFKPITGNFMQSAVDVTGLSLATLAQTGTEPNEAMASFVDWVKTVAGDRKPVFASFGTFDWMFTKWYLTEFGCENGQRLFGSNGIDMKSYYMGMMNTSWIGTRKGKILNALKPNVRHTHNALDDALEQAELFARMLRHNGEITSKKLKVRA